MADHGLSGRVHPGRGRAGGRPPLDDRRRAPAAHLLHRLDPVGRRVARPSPARLGRTVLELGGNNAILVADDADLDLAVRAVLFGAVGTAGQRCTSTRRLIVHARAAETNSARGLAKAYGQVPIGDPLQGGTLMGPLVTNGQWQPCSTLSNSAVADGGEVLTGGQDRPTSARSLWSRRSSVCPRRRRSSGRDLRADPLRARPTTPRRGHPRCTTACRRGCLPPSSPTACARPSVPGPRRVRLRHRQRQHRHVGRGDRRRVRRREGDGRRPRVRLRRVEGLHAAPDEHDQLEMHCRWRRGSSSAGEKQFER
jgi:hypothetical protein